MQALAGTTVVSSLAGCAGIGGDSEFEQEIETIRQAVDPYDGNIEQALEDG